MLNFANEKSISFFAETSYYATVIQLSTNTNHHTMKTLLNSLLLTLGTFMACATQVSAQTLVDRFSADGDTTSDGSWTSSAGSNSGTVLDLSGLSSTDPVAPGGAGFTNSFSFNGAGATEADDATVSGALYQSLTDISVDIWFKADTESQKSVLFATGGRERGFTLGYDNGNLLFFMKDGQTGGADAKLALSAAMGIDATAGFVRATVSIDDTNDAVYLYSNGGLIASSAPGDVTFADVTGNNNTTIAGFLAGQIGGGDLDNDGDTTIDDMGTFNSFSGDIAAVDVYSGVIAIPESASFALLASVAAFGVVFVRRRRG